VIKKNNSAEWEILNNADAIIFGSPAYMGGVADDFKKNADLSSKIWYEAKWKNKIAGGFTNSRRLNADKFITIQYLWTLAMQHAMIWVSLGIFHASKKSSTTADINYMGGFAGALAVSLSDSSAEEAGHTGDLETAKLYGKRIAQITQQFNK